MEGGPRGLGVRGTAGRQSAWDPGEASRDSVPAPSLAPAAQSRFLRTSPSLKPPLVPPCLALVPDSLRVLASAPRTGPGSSVPVSRPGPATLRRPLAFRLVGGRLRGRGRACPPPQHGHVRPISPVRDVWVELRAHLMGRPESRRELCRTPPPGAGNATSFGNSVFAGVNEDGGSDEAQGGGWSDAATGQGSPGPPGSGGEGQGLWRGRGPGTTGRQTSDLQPVALSHPAGGPCSGSPETDAQQSAGEGAEAQGSSSRSQLGRELGRRSLSPA